MIFYDLAHERYSVRKFSDRPVEEEKLGRVLEAGRVAPTAVNFQPHRILVVRGQGMEKMKKATPYTFGAPLMVVIGYDENESWKSLQGLDAGIVDSTVVTTQLMYAAWEEGLGSTFVGHFDEETLRKEFDMPDFFHPVAMLPLGYAAEDCRPHPKLHYSRKPLEETVFYDTLKDLKPAEGRRKK